MSSKINRIIHGLRLRHFPMRLSRLLGCLIISVMLLASQIGHAGAEESESMESLLPLVGGALVDAGSQEWEQASRELEQFEKFWNEIMGAGRADDFDKQIQTRLAAARTALDNKDKEDANAALSALAKKVNEYVDTHTEDNNLPVGKESAGELLSMVEKTLTPLQSGDIEQAQSRFKTIVQGWSKFEGPIRSGNFAVYSDLETHLSLIRIALQAEPVKSEQAIAELQSLKALLQDYSDGKLDVQDSSAGERERKTLRDALPLLRQALQAAEAKDADTASSRLQEFIVLWPSVEGEVSISSATLYTATENEMSEAQGYLVSSPPDTVKAVEIISRMINDLELISDRGSYSAWDAALILLREGLEAILVLAALLAFLKRSGDRSGRVSIWAGAGTGLVLSGILAVVLTLVVSEAISGGTRELIEGVVGLFAVVMMLTVGQWLHSKSNAQAWNKYLNEQVGGALARGNRWSLFALAGLAILREGAETAVFYIGMAPSIEPKQLVTGILGALAALTLLGFCLIRFTVKLPVRMFMLTATVLIYYLVIRFLGEGIHALQIAGVIPGHNYRLLPSVGWIGAYPTWETFIPQVIVLTFILWRLFASNLRKSSRQDNMSL